MRKLAGILLGLALCLPGLLHAQGMTRGLAPNGPTVIITGAVSGSIPSPVQALSAAGYGQQYMISNGGTVTAFVSYGATAAAATTACVVPTAGTGQNVIPVFTLMSPMIALQPGTWFCVITPSSTAAVYITPMVPQ